jgi:pimeloyl-ACP methyl ester carboxylesterase
MERKDADTMKFLFEDDSFSFETLRAIGYAVYNGADIGEVVTTCRNIPDGDELAWMESWSALAARVADVGRTALAAGHTVSAREALLRAANYYRAADFYYREDPEADQARSLRLARASQQAFADAVPLLDTPARSVAVPYGDTTLPGYLYLVDDSGTPRPTVLINGGYDSTVEELYFLAAGALRRGYHVLTWDGPGQGANVRDQHLYFRHDWEAVVTPAVDLLQTVPEVDTDELVLIGMSLGGYFATRAAAFEHRLAACVAYDGVWDFEDAITRFTATAAQSPGGVEALMARSTMARWVIRCGLFSLGVSTFEELVEAAKPYTMEGIADRITCPTLVLDAENDQFFKGQPERLYDALTCSKDIIVFPEAEGSGEHCQDGAITTFHQRTFDWLDTVLAQRRSPSVAV